MFLWGPSELVGVPRALLFLSLHGLSRLPAPGRCSSSSVASKLGRFTRQETVNAWAQARTVPPGCCVRCGCNSKQGVPTVPPSSRPSSPGSTPGRQPIERRCLGRASHYITCRLLIPIPEQELGILPISASLSPLPAPAAAVDNSSPP